MERRLQVGREVRRTRFGAHQGWIWDAQLAGTQSGAGLVEVGEYVDGTAEVAIVARHAATELHPAEHGALHEDNLVLGALGEERLRQAVLHTAGCIDTFQYDTVILKIF